MAHAANPGGRIAYRLGPVRQRARRGWREPRRTASASAALRDRQQRHAIHAHARRRAGGRDRPADHRRAVRRCVPRGVRRHAAARRVARPGRHRCVVAARARCRHPARCAQAGAAGEQLRSRLRRHDRNAAGLRPALLGRRRRACRLRRRRRCGTGAVVHRAGGQPTRCGAAAQLAATGHLRCRRSPVLARCRIGRAALRRPFRAATGLRRHGPARRHCRRADARACATGARGHARRDLRTAAPGGAEFPWRLARAAAPEPPRRAVAVGVRDPVRTCRDRHGRRAVRLVVLRTATEPAADRRSAQRLADGGRDPVPAGVVADQRERLDAAAGRARGTAAGARHDTARPAAQRPAWPLRRRARQRRDPGRASAARSEFARRRAGAAAVRSDRQRCDDRQHTPQHRREHQARRRCGADRMPPPDARCARRLAGGRGPLGRAREC